MHIALTPFYKDIFDEDIPKIQELIADVPSKVVVTYLAYLNSRLHLNSSIENQIEIINEMLQRQSSETKNKVKENLKYFILKNENNREVGLVSSFHLLSLIHIALCNYTDFNFIDTTPEQELNIFKAYLVVVDQKAEESSETYLREREVKEGDFFPKHTWPVLLNQMEATPHYDPITDLIKAMCFFNFLEYHTDYSIYVTEFLNKCGHKSTWEYVIEFMNIIKQRCNNENKNSSFSISCDNNAKPLYESLCINPITYRQKFENRIENHSFMKATPLFKFKDIYVVLDWSYLYNKLYDGLVFDFFTRSGIKELQDLNTIPMFKKFIGKKITEEFTFQKLLTGIFNKKYAHLLFPEDDSMGEPDAYYRENNKIVLFEIKDSFFAGNVLTSNSYLQIKSEIDKKYNNSKKGTGQLLKQIQRLKETSFEKKSYTELKKNPKNFIIYPVILYTDVHFGMPGVNNYISQEFEKQLTALNLKNSFRRIEKLTFLNLSFVIKHFNCIKEVGLFNILEKVQQELEKRRKKHEFKREIEFLFRYNSPPEQIIEEIIDCESRYEMDFKELAQLLNLTEGLPS